MATKQGNNEKGPKGKLINKYINKQKNIEEKL